MQPCSAKQNPFDNVYSNNALFILTYFLTVTSLFQLHLLTDCDPRHQNVNLLSPINMTQIGRMAG